MRELFEKGGPFMWPLLVSLVFGVAMVLERLWNLTWARRRTKDFLKNVQIALDEGGPEQAVRVCEESVGPVPSGFRAALVRLHWGIDKSESAIRDSVDSLMNFLERGLPWLATVANIAPMLGFLGTVSGMIGAFSAIAEAGDVEPSIVASGISEALITTATGLAIAIPIQFFHNFFVSRIDRIIVDVEEGAMAFLNTLSEKHATRTETVER